MNNTELIERARKLAAEGKLAPAPSHATILALADALEAATGEVEWESAVFMREPDGAFKITTWESIHEAQGMFPGTTYIEQRRKVLGPWLEVQP